ncbi:glycoside hydrolase family 95 protein [Brevundimonas sp. VNH65]|uniref:glycoside hydrolase family 95 protein n=1 Tax=Brevundimonas sp. VNH65 TaxID=3400917 RepID=UPI003C0A1E9C
MSFGRATSRRGLLAGGAALALTAAAGPIRAQAVATARPAAADPNALKLWYRAPAEAWTEALPIGNGRLGAMVFGGVARERLQLNEDTLWGGGPYDPSSPEALEALPEVRRLIFAGEYLAAQALAHEKMMARPIRQMSYQTVGDLMLTFGASSQASDYRRDLDLETGIAAVTYARDGVRYRREIFASHPADAVIVRLTADTPGRITFDAEFETPQPGDAVAEGDRLFLKGRNTGQHGIASALTFEACVQVEAEGGRVTTRGGRLTVDGADAATIRIVMATSHVGPKQADADPAVRNRQALARSAGQTAAALRDAHVADHSALFGRVSIDLGPTFDPAQSTDVRIARSLTQEDPGLAALYMQYGRYLLIACSRPGTQAANLQGLWNDRLNPPWGCKYTININTEMNYWPAEPGNLAECVEPLVRLVREAAETGATTARVNYGARGWVAHHNLDLWRATAPIDQARYGMWPTGGAWLCKHLWDHWDYCGDRAYLAEVYPLMKGASRFFLDVLVEDPKGRGLVTCPSMSPENLHPFGASICAGPAMDSQILRDLFDNTVAAAETLGLDRDFRAEVRAARARLPADQIGKDGQLQEWLDDWDMEAPEQDHRHVSHLYGLYPSDQISVGKTPELAAAARRSLEIRGDLSTGWAIGWRINLWTRLLDGDRAHTVLKLLLGPERTYPNMFDAHPPFQIDGNFGGAAGIMGMLFHSADGEIDLLPALPSAWPRGSVSGVRARGGLEMDLSWSAARPDQVTLRGAPDTPFVVRFGDVRTTGRLDRNGRRRLRLSEGGWTQA